MKYGLIFGGSSYEHEISIVSAIVLKKLIKTPLEFIFLDANRDFYLIDGDDLKSTFFSTMSYKKSLKLLLQKGGFYKKTLFGLKPLEFDVAINLIHGRDGEDGKMASLLEFFDIPSITPSIEASAISYNKLLTKLYAKEKGVLTIPYEVIRRDSDTIKTSYPFILKPLRLGSSIGISIVRNKDELEYAKDVAFEFDNEVLIEPFIEGINEYNLAGYFGKNGFVFSKIEKVKKSDYLDFEKKYCDFARSGKVEEVELPSGLEERLKKYFMDIYGGLFEGSLIRCDFFEKDGEVYLNEINPIPGSLANYLFDDISGALEDIVLKNEKKIGINYAYINKIKSVKGK